MRLQKSKFGRLMRSVVMCFFSNADIKNKEQAIKTVKTGKYTYIFTSPKLASIESFRSLL